LQAGNHGRLRRVIDRHQHPDFSLGTCTKCNRENAFDGPDSTCCLVATAPSAFAARQIPSILETCGGIQLHQKPSVNISAKSG
jgi:hypothetical protein